MDFNELDSKLLRQLQKSEAGENYLFRSIMTVERNPTLSVYYTRIIKFVVYGIPQPGHNKLGTVLRFSLEVRSLSLHCFKIVGFNVPAHNLRVVWSIH